jgi:hypothetical protein
MMLGRRIKSLSVLMAALIALIAQPAQAQSRDPARALRLEGEPSTPEDLRLLQRFSHCVAQRHPAQAAALLAADYRERSYTAGMRRLAQGNAGCVPLGRAKFSGILFAGGMAETLLQRQNLLADLAARIVVNPARPLQAREESEVMSICTVRAAPAQVVAMLNSDAASAEEGAAFRAVMPNVGECLAAGVNLRLNRPALRAMLALAAYRLVQNNAAAAPAGN